MLAAIGSEMRRLGLRIYDVARVRRQRRLGLLPRGLRGLFVGNALRRLVLAKGDCLRKGVRSASDRS